MSKMSNTRNVHVAFLFSIGIRTAKLLAMAVRAYCALGSVSNGRVRATIHYDDAHTEMQIFINEASDGQTKEIFKVLAQPLV